MGTPGIPWTPAGPGRWSRWSTGSARIPRFTEPVGRSTRLYFATDLHGSDKCFRKFVNAAAVYKPDVMVLGGDLAGKAIQGITRNAGGRYHCTFRGTTYDVEAGPQLDGRERMIADHGYYPVRGGPGQLEAERADGAMDRLVPVLKRDRLAERL